MERVEAPEYLSWDELLQHIIDLRVQENEKAWEFAAACAVALERYQAKPGDIAAQVNCSARHVSNMAKVYLAFPQEEDRALELTISHHLACMKTDNPRAWLEKTEQEQYSVRQLKEAIKQDKGQVSDPEKEAARAWAKVEKILSEEGPGADYIEEQMVDYLRDKLVVPETGIKKLAPPV